jgi:Domain of unknown function (DUF3854)
MGKHTRTRGAKQGYQNVSSADPVPRTWREFRERVAPHLNLPLELESFGAHFRKRTASAGGWLEFSFEAHNRWRHNKRYLIHVDSLWVMPADKDSPEPGRSFFELAAERGPFRDRHTAERHYSKQTGVPLPDGGAAELEIAPPRLLPQHLAELRRSGLDEADAAAAGVHSLTDAAVIARTLHIPERWARLLGPCLAFPYLDPRTGGPTGHCRLKPDRPRVDRDGKTIKYESPKGAGLQAYFPPLARSALKDPKVTLVITEGEKKALAGCKHGLPTVGLAGVYGWSKRLRNYYGRKCGPKMLIDDLEAVTWDGRWVWVAFDSDGRANPMVQRAAEELADILRCRGAYVTVIFLPPGDGGKKAGLDDFLTSQTTDDFWRLDREEVTTRRAPNPRFLEMNVKYASGKDLERNARHEIWKRAARASKSLERRAEKRKSYRPCPARFRACLQNLADPELFGGKSLRCRRHSCVACHPVLCDEWDEHFTAPEYGRVLFDCDGKALVPVKDRWLWEGTADGLKAATDRVRRAGAEYGAVRGDTSAVVVASAEFSGARRVPAAQAAAAMSRALAALPRRGGRPVSTSDGWKRPGRDEREWKYRGSVRPENVEWCLARLEMEGLKPWISKNCSWVFWNFPSDWSEARCLRFFEYGLTDLGELPGDGTEDDLVTEDRPEETEEAPAVMPETVATLAVGGLGSAAQRLLFPQGVLGVYGDRR